MNIPLKPNTFDNDELINALRKIVQANSPVLAQHLLEELANGQVRIHLGETLANQIADALKRQDKIEIRHCAGLVQDAINNLWNFQRQLSAASE
jgi:dihydroneopterin aldolase